MTNSYGVQNYLNTLIFCVVAKTVTVVLLSLMVFEKVRYFAFLLLTVELGLIIIIISALIVISSYNTKVTKMQESYGKSKFAALACPDYYMRNIENDETYCEDTYKTPDNKFIYKFSESMSTPEYRNYAKKIPIDSTKTVDELCQKIATAPEFKEFSWTSIKSKCNY